MEWNSTRLQYVLGTREAMQCVQLSCVTTNERTALMMNRRLVAVRKAETEGRCKVLGLGCGFCQENMCEVSDSGA